MSTLAGQTFGNYRLETIVGTGGMGQVYRARHVHLEAIAAVKVMHPHVAQDRKFRECFRDEARNAHALAHPGIVKVVDFGEQDDHFYLVMEYVPDGSLRALLQQPTRPSLAVAVDLVRQAADGLAFAHAAHMVHRDIKPDNLLIARERGDGGRLIVKISDFGLSKLAEGGVATTAASVIGTPAYMSPEQCQGLPLDGRSDLYSLGVVLYEVATGYLPFEIKTSTDAVYKHVFTPAPSPRSVRPELPAALDSIIQRCLAKQPGDRFASASELSTALQELKLTESSAPPAAMPEVKASSTTVVMPRAPAQPAVRIAVTAAAETLTITPGQPALFHVTLANLGTTVDHLTLAVHGVPSEWVQGPAAPVQLNPGMKAAVALTVAVPRTPAGRAGQYNVRIVATSREQPSETGQVGARWTVLPFTAFRCDLVPAQAAGRTRATYRVALHNDGNARIKCRFHASDDEQALTYGFGLGIHADESDEAARVEPGDKAAITLRLRAPRCWIGRSQLRTFQVRANLRDVEAPPQVASGRFLHRPVVPAWVIPIVVLVVAAAFMLLRLLLRPEVTTVEFKPERPFPGQEVEVVVTAARAREITVDPPGTRVGPRGDTFRFENGLREGTSAVSVSASNWWGVSPARQFAVYLSPRPAAPQARIDSFVIDKQEVKSGDTVTVSWRVADAVSVELLPYGTVPAEGTRQFVTRTEGPGTDGSTLIATGSGGPPMRRSFEVTVRATNTQAGPAVPPALIEEFAIEPQRARKGEKVIVRWRVSQARSVAIKPFGPVPLQGTREFIIPAQAETPPTFNLVATNTANQSVNQPATVELLPPLPAIDQFEIDKKEAQKGDTVTVRWRVSNAKTVEIQPHGVVEPQGEKSFVIQRDGPGDETYTLVASNGFEPPVNKPLTVQVRAVAAAVVEQFSVEPSRAKPGDTVTVTWRVRNAESVELKPFGTVPLEGKRQHTIKRDAQEKETFTLTARARGAAPTTQEDSVDVVPAPRAAIEQFEIDPRQARKGDTVTVRWRVRDAEAVELQPLGKVGLEGEKTWEIRDDGPAKLVFTLTASNEGQQPVSRSREVALLAPAPPPPPAAALPEIRDFRLSAPEVRKRRRGHDLLGRHQCREGRAAALRHRGEDRCDGSRSGEDPGIPPHCNRRRRQGGGQAASGDGALTKTEREMVMLRSSRLAALTFLSAMCFVRLGGAAQTLEFRVTEVTLAPKSSTIRTTCPTTVEFAGSITANGAGMARYQLVKSTDASPTQAIYDMPFTEAGTKSITASFLVDRSMTAYQIVRVTSAAPPLDSSREAGTFTVDCVAAPPSPEPPRQPPQEPRAGNRSRGVQRDTDSGRAW